MRKASAQKEKSIKKESRAVRFLALFFVAALIISILPMLYLSLFDYANGDDFNYGYMTHQTWLHTGSLLSVLQSACTVVKNTWNTWQGTWSSVFLFSLQPGIWNERAYGLTVWIALFCILGGTFYFTYVILRGRLKMSMPLFLILWALLEILTLQFIPNIKTAVFWYTSVSHYIIPLGAALFVLGWTLRWLETGKKRYFVGIVILMSYLGGAGYPLVVLAGAGVFFALLFALFQYRKRIGVKRALLLLIPLGLELIGFAVSAAAPGNKIRAGEDFGFSMSRVVGTVRDGFLHTAQEIVDAALRPELLIPILLVTVFAALIYRPIQTSDDGKMSMHPMIFAVLALLLSALIRMPAIYAGVDVSSGVPDTEYAVTILAVFMTLIYFACWGKSRYLKRSIERGKQSSTVLVQSGVEREICVALVVLLMGTCVIARHSLKNTSDYLCIDFIRSGRLSDFEAQMQERIAILMDDSNPNPVVPEMNNDQGPFMHMALLDDPDSFTNWATRMYYGKDSVIAVPREVYEQEYRNGKKIEK